MSDLYCSECENFIQRIEKNNKLVYFCPDCNIEKEMPTNVASRMYVNDIKDTEFYGVNELHITSIIDDPTNPKICIKCSNKNCDSDILYYKRKEKTLERIFVCPKCKQTWMEER